MKVSPGGSLRSEGSEGKLRGVRRNKGVRGKEEQGVRVSKGERGEQSPQV